MTKGSSEVKLNSTVAGVFIVEPREEESWDDSNELELVVGQARGSLF
jgi:hypothetical protein